MGQHTRGMRTPVTIALLLLLAAALAAPWMAGSPQGLAIYEALSRACHQQPERSWSLAGAPIAFCVRCLGVYAGALAAALVGARFSRLGAAVSVILLGADWLAEAAGWLGPRPWTRFVIGGGAGFFLVSSLWGEPKPRPARSTP